MPVIGNLGSDEVGQVKLFPGQADTPFGGMWTAGYHSRIRKDTEAGRPGYYAVDLVDAKTRVELTATAHTGWMRFRLPQESATHLVFNFAAPAEEKGHLFHFEVRQVGAQEIEGSLTQDSQYAGQYTVYFVAQFSEPMQQMNAWEEGTYSGSESNYGVDWRIPRKLQNKIKEFSSSQAGGVWLDFDGAGQHILTMRTGISLVGIEQARKNLTVESAPHGFSFDSVASAAAETWNGLLSRIEVEGGSEDDRTLLYTNLYRAYSSKSMVDDVDGSYRDACGEVNHVTKPGDHAYSSDSLWGTQWELSPLWTLISPEVTSSFIRFMIAEAGHNGWLPQAPTNLRYSPVMVAQHEIAMITGAWQKAFEISMRRPRCRR
jgi:putative alpha-1,2-mannosidase